MLKKQPACEPCRTQKLACDHARPVCRRCLERGEPDSCTYRPRPFKRSAARRQRQCPSTTPAATSTQVVVPASSAEAGLTSDTSQTQESEVIDGNGNGVGWRPVGDTGQSWDPHPPYHHQHHYHTRPIHYPNPGYLGPSSHTTLFNQVRLESIYPELHHPTGSSPQQPTEPGSAPPLDTGPPTEQEPTVDEDDIDAGARFIMELGRLPAPLARYADLVQGWINKGANLALAADVTECCIRATVAALTGFNKTYTPARAISQSLFAQSRRKVMTIASTTLDDYRRNLTSPGARWETLGLFLTALCRATTDVAYFEPLYDSQSQRCKLQRLSLNFSDRCLDLALSLDCLNDFQLFLQYENFISHTQIDGDQSLFCPLSNPCLCHPLHCP